MSLQKQTMTKNTAMFLLSIAAQKAMTLVYFVIVANVFGPAEQGRYSAALAFTTLFGVFVDVGTSAMLTRQSARDGRGVEKMVRQMFFSRIILGIVVYGSMIALSHALNYPSELIYLISIAGIAAVIDTCSVATWSVIRGFHNLTNEAIGGVLAIGIMVGLGGSAIGLHLPLEYLVYAVLAGSVGNFLYALWVLSHKLHISFVPLYDWHTLKEMVLLSLPFAGAAIFSRIYTYTDATLLASIAGEEAVGWFMAANKMILALNLIPSSLSASLYPTLSSFALSSPHRISSMLAKTLYVLILIVVPIAAGMVILAPHIVSVFYNNHYLPTIGVMQVLSISMVFGFLCFPFGALFAATNQQQKNTILYGIAATLSIVGNISLITLFGVVGAALTALVVSCFIFLASLAWSQAYWKPEMPYLIRSTLKIVLATGGMALVLLSIGNALPFAIVLIVGCATYILFCFALRIVTKADVMLVANSLMRKGDLGVSAPTDV
ncbi:MAG: flippase [Patescibacteria group bacterium]